MYSQKLSSIKSERTIHFDEIEGVMKHKLTAKIVEQAKVTNGKAFQRFSDGHGLTLVVRSGGTKAWEYRFTKLDGKGSNLGLGRIQRSHCQRPEKSFLSLEGFALRDKILVLCKELGKYSLNAVQVIQ